VEEKARLEEELTEKKRILEQIESESPKTFDEVRMFSENAERLIFEAGVLEEQIRVIDEEIETLSVEEKAKDRVAILQKANVLSTEKKGLLVRLEQIKVEGEKLREAFEEATPRKRVQISSGQHLKWQRTIKEPHFVFKLRGDPTRGEDTFKREETVSDALPIRIKSMLAGGWQLCPGQEIVEEELTTANSRLVPIIATPEIFDSFT
jgi:hypothetical protein